MNDLIRKLSDNVSDARLRVDALGMRNISGLDYEERRKLEQEYSLAKNSLYIAEKELEKAVNS